MTKYWTFRGGNIMSSKVDFLITTVISLPTKIKIKVTIPNVFVNHLHTLRQAFNLQWSRNIIPIQDWPFWGCSRIKYFIFLHEQKWVVVRNIRCPLLPGQIKKKRNITQNIFKTVREIFVMTWYKVYIYMCDFKASTK